MSESLKESTRVLITGGAGFIGSHLAETLLSLGLHVTVLDDLSTGSIANIEHLAGNPLFRLAVEHITNEVMLDRLAGECDVIFHLAAVVGAELVIKDATRTIQTNVMGTQNVLDAALRHRVKVIFTSSSEVYGKGAGIPFGEDSDVVYGPTASSRWSYAGSKMLGEHLALDYHRKGLPVVISRLFNIVGPRQTHRYGMVVPRFILQSLRDETLRVHGDGKQSRCFLHVGDAVEALITLAACPQATGQVFNIGSTEEITILDLARKILALTNGNGANRTVEGSRQTAANPENRITFVSYEEVYGPGFEDMRQRAPDISKIIRYTGWKPKRSLHEALLDVIDHFRCGEGMATD